MKINGSTIDFFNTLPDELLVEIAENDWESLKNLCMALTLDIELVKQEYNDPKKSKKKKDLAS